MQRSTKSELVTQTGIVCMSGPQDHPHIQSVTRRISGIQHVDVVVAMDLFPLTSEVTQLYYRSGPDYLEEPV